MSKEKKIFKCDDLNSLENVSEKLAFGLEIYEHEHHPTEIKLKGHVFFELVNLETSETISFDKKNVISLDAGILLARLCADPQEPAFGINMLAIGTGATGALLSPDSPDARQRSLNAEISRKPFESIIFRNSSGVAVAYKTRIVDFTAKFGPGEGTGALNEMALISTISGNPLITNPVPNIFPTYTESVDLSLYDTMVNYFTFGVITKPAMSNLRITWRLTF